MNDINMLNGLVLWLMITEATKRGLLPRENGCYVERTKNKYKWSMIDNGDATIILTVTLSEHAAPVFNQPNERTK